jgi:hypothetical protein
LAWPTESDRDLDRPARIILRALYEQKLTPEEALSVIAELDLL